MEEAKTIVKYGRIYAVAEIINRVAGIILIPLYTHILNVTEYGIYALVFSVTDFLSIIIGMGLARAMSRFYFDFSENQEMRNKVISTALLGFLGIGLLLVVCSYPLSRLIVEILFGSADYTIIFALAISAVMFIIFLEIAMGYFFIQKQALSYLGVSMGKALLLLATNGFFFYYLEMGVLGIVTSTITSFAVLSIMIGVIIFRKVGLGFSVSIFKQMLSFGLPLIPAAVAATGNQLIQRYYLNTLEGTAAVGIISLSNRLASLLQMFVARPFYRIFFIRRFETLTEGKDQSDLNQVLLIFVAVVGVGGLLLGLFGNEIIYIIAPEEYRIAALYIPLFCLSIMIAVIERNFQVGLLYQKKTKELSVIAIISLAIGVPSNYFFIILYGPMGAVLAYLLICVVRLLLIVKANSQIGVSQIQLDWLRAIIILALVSTISTLGYQYWAHDITVPLVIFKAGLLGFFVFTLITSPLLDETSRKIIISFFKKKLIKV